MTLANLTVSVLDLTGPHTRLAWLGPGPDRTGFDRLLAPASRVALAGLYRQGFLYVGTYIRVVLVMALGHAWLVGLTLLCQVFA